jgi:hypothetical protein
MWNWARIGKAAPNVPGIRTVKASAMQSSVKVVALPVPSACVVINRRHVGGATEYGETSRSADSLGVPSYISRMRTRIMLHKMQQLGSLFPRGGFSSRIPRNSEAPPSDRHPARILSSSICSRLQQIHLYEVLDWSASESKDPLALGAPRSLTRMRRTSPYTRLSLSPDIVPLTQHIH